MGSGVGVGVGFGVGVGDGVALGVGVGDGVGLGVGVGDGVGLGIAVGLGVGMGVGATSTVAEEVAPSTGDGDATIGVAVPNSVEAGVGDGSALPPPHASPASTSSPSNPPKENRRQAPGCRSIGPPCGPLMGGRQLLAYGVLKVR